jgi:acetylornithine deacetylase/succinyl-diaminopimelate desuccinylase-like protein
MTDPRIPIIQSFIHDHSDEFVSELQRFIRLPSVSTTGEGVRRCAENVVQKLQSFGMEALLLETDGNPLVFGQLSSDINLPTLLITTHYDVQPPGSSNAWVFPPYSATKDDDRIWGRGASDAKGPLLAVISAIETLARAKVPLRINVKVLFDGEEEIGSPSMPRALEQHKQLLAADAVVTLDGNSMADGRPVINFGGGGLLYLQLEVRTARTDIHANRGALVPNAAWRLIWALASLKTPDENIAVSGFNENLLPVSTSDRKLLKSHIWSDEDELEALGAFSFLAGRGGDRGPEALHLLPILGISGFQSGYDGEGVGAVIPAYARAMVYIGLRDNQTPPEIQEKILRHLDQLGYDDIQVTVLGSTEPSFHRSESPIASLVTTAVMKTVGRPPVTYPRGHWYGRQGSWIGSRIGADAAQVSIVAPAQPNDHAPNEFIPLDYFLRGIEFVSQLIIDCEYLPVAPSDPPL